MPAYLVADLGVLPGFITSTASAINNAGQIVGYEQTADHAYRAFIGQNGVMTDLGTLGGRNSYAFGINDLGQVVGVSDSVDTNGIVHDHAFVWQNGVMTDLDPSDSYSLASGINNLGQIVGQIAIDDASLHAMLWQNGSSTDLGTLPGGSSSSATAINNAGQIVGVSDGDPFLWQDGAMTALEIPGDYARINALNDAGQAVGAAMSGFQVLGAVRWDPDGHVYDIGVGYSGEATDINNSGQIIGEGDYPYLIQNGVVTDLYNEVAYGGAEVHVQSINNAGQIAANSNGHAVLLNPVAGDLPTLTINNVTVTEGNSGTTNAVFTVSLSTPVNWPVTVQYATADDTAAAGSDYQAATGQLSFAPGETSKTIAVAVIGDRLHEPNETFTVNLSNATNAIANNLAGVGTIVDDDPLIGISISDAVVTEGRKNQTTLITFTVTLSSASDQPVTVWFKTTDGTAKTSDSDYVAKTGTLTFNPGETTKTITIEVKGDSKKEANETFYVDLFGNSGNSLFNKNRGIGTILNDD